MRYFALIIFNHIKRLCRYILSALKTGLFWRRTLLLAGCGLAVLFVITVFWFQGINISKLDAPLPSPTTILDRYGQKATQLSASKITPVPLSQVPDELQKAIVAVEDRRFYEHPGVDIRGLARAIMQNLKSGGYSQGGSTITQQLAKNVFLTSDKSLWRKWKEIGYAIKLDMNYSKNEILEFYLNRIYFGEGTWGIQGAAKRYFSKNVQDLNLAECALLAALPKAPTYYSPLNNKEKALERRNLVLQMMREQNMISSEDFNLAKAMPIALQEGSDDSKGKYPSYLDFVIEEASREFGFTEEQLITGGLIIYTELDPSVQQAVQDVYANDSLFPESPKDQLIQSGAVILDQHNGGIRGLIGNRGDSVFRGFNRASQLKRQPGSTFKPLAVYGPALEKGYSPDSALFDGELNIGGYQPKDYDHQYRGTVLLRDAVSMSLNIPAVWLLNQISLPTGLDFIGRTGITLDKTDRNLGVALGGLNTGVSPLQMAQAYSAFANLGTMHTAHAITKITTVDGKILAQASGKQTKVTDPNTAYTMTQLLQDVVQRGTGRNAALSRPAAGKSGTTELPETKEFSGIGTNAAKDAWFVGYTPELTAAVWLGYDKTDREHYLTTSGGAVPAQLFREILTIALQDKPVVPFDLPPAETIAAANQEKPKQDLQSKKNREDILPDEKHEKNEKHDHGKGKNKH